MKSIQYQVETGVGVDDQNPQMIVQYSIDGGRTYSNERWLFLGKTGDYVTVEDNSNRKFNDLVVKIKYTEPTAFSIYNANIYIREAGRLISRIPSSQIGNTPYVPPILPWVWSDDKKASDTFITKTSDGRLNFTLSRDGIGGIYKYAMTEPFNIMKEYAGKIYWEVSFSEMAVEFGFYPLPDFAEYETNDLYADNPKILQRFSKAGQIFPTNLDTDLYLSDGTQAIDTGNVNYNGNENRILMFAIEITETYAKFWKGVDGVWTTGDPSSGVDPFDESTGSYTGLIPEDLYFFVRANNIFNNGGPISFDMTIYGSDDNPFNYAIPTGFNGT